MLALLSSTQGGSRRSFQPFLRFPLLIATLVGPACHDAVAPKSPPPIPSFTIVSGDGQTAIAGSELAQPLVAQATDGSGTPIAGLTVFFVVTQGSGHLYAGGGVTNSNGNVKDYWTLGTVAGAPQTVEVRAVDPTTGAKNSYATFTATATVGPAAIIKGIAGDGQTAFTRALVAIRPAVQVTDAFGNPVSGVSVAFAITAGAGTLSGTPVPTNSNGVATLAGWRLGLAPGTNNNIVTASSGGLSPSVRFTATAKFGLKSVFAGNEHSCGLSAGNDLYCWGLNNNGQLGDGTTAPRYAPVRLANGMLPTGVAVGANHTCLVLATGNAYCWGYNVDGQLGNGTTTTSTTPVQVGGVVVPYTRITAGVNTTCGLTSVGAVYCWGYNGNGQFGNGGTSSSSVPTLAANGKLFRSISIGGRHACGLTSAGVAWCWGANDYGELGNATTTSSLTPVLVAGGHTFSALVLGYDHSCGLATGGVAYCWGLNTSGQLGLGGFAPNSFPQPAAVQNHIVFTQLAAGISYNCGITASNAAYCWGNNGNAQLGLGNTDSPVRVPNPVTGGYAFSAITAGMGSHTCALPVGGGSPYCWGRNVSGQLGNGTNVSSPIPTQVVPPPIP